MQTPHTDPIIAEIRAIREEHAARFGYDVKAIFTDGRHPTSKRSKTSKPSKGRLAVIMSAIRRGTRHLNRKNGHGHDSESTTTYASDYTTRIPASKHPEFASMSRQETALPTLTA